MPGVSFTEPTAIDNLGEVAGNASEGTDEPSIGFVDIGGRITTFGYPRATSTVVTGMNDFGQVVGDYYDEGSELSEGPLSPYRCPRR